MNMSSATFRTSTNRFLTYFFDSIAQRAIKRTIHRDPPPPSRCQKRVLLLSLPKAPVLLPHHLSPSFQRLLIIRHRVEPRFLLRSSSLAAPDRCRELNQRALCLLELVQTGPLRTIPSADSKHYPRTRWLNRSRSQMILLDVRVFGTS